MRVKYLTVSVRQSSAVNLLRLWSEPHWPAAVEPSGGSARGDPVCFLPWSRSGSRTVRLGCERSPSCWFRVWVSGTGCALLVCPCRRASVTRERAAGFVSSSCAFTRPRPEGGGGHPWVQSAPLSRTTVPHWWNVTEYIYSSATFFFHSVLLYTFIYQIIKCEYQLITWITEGVVLSELLKVLM